MSLEDIPFQPRIWHYPEKVLGEEARTPRDKRWPSFLHGEWRTDSLEAGCLDPAPQPVLAGTLQNRSCSFREMPAAEGAWAGGLEMARDPLDRVDSQSAGLAALRSVVWKLLHWSTALGDSFDLSFRPSVPSWHGV